MNKNISSLSREPNLGFPVLARHIRVSDNRIKLLFAKYPPLRLLTPSFKVRKRHILSEYSCQNGTFVGISGRFAEKGAKNGPSFVRLAISSRTLSRETLILAFMCQGKRVQLFLRI